MGQYVACNMWRICGKPVMILLHVPRETRAFPKIPVRFSEGKNLHSLCQRGAPALLISWVISPILPHKMKLKEFPKSQRFNDLWYFKVTKIVICTFWVLELTELLIWQVSGRCSYSFRCSGQCEHRICIPSTGLSCCSHLNGHNLVDTL